jgi:SAM-dependent methyltransferase
MERVTRHPAKFSDNILRAIQPLIPARGVVLDIFGGTGRLGEICSPIINELEFDWCRVAAQNAPTVCGNALYLPFANNSVDAIITSPAYGNRMADHHEAKDGSKRNTYRHALGKPLQTDNSGAMQWGSQYRQFHYEAWVEAYRVLRENGVLILNISNHIRKGVEIHVSEFHTSILKEIGFDASQFKTITTRRNGFGQNGKSRVDCEMIIVFAKV